MLRPLSLRASVLALAGTLFLAPTAQAGFLDKLTAPAAGGATVKSTAKVLQNEPGLWRAKRDSRKMSTSYTSTITNVVTTGAIERKGARVKIDFTKPEDVKQIRNNDVIHLDAGLYKALPANAASNLTFIGVEGQTLLGGTGNPFAPGNTLELYSKSPRFWDMVIGNVTIHNTEGRVYLVNSRVVGLTRLKQSPLNLPFNTDLVAVFSRLDAGGIPTHSLSTSLRINSRDNTTPFALFLSHGYRAFGDSVVTDVDVAEDFVGARQVKPPLLSLQDRYGASLYGGPAFFTPEVASELHAARKPMLQAAQDYDRNQKRAGEYAGLQRDTQDEAMRFLSWKTGWSPTVDMQKADALLAKAAEELKTGNAVLALALVNRTMSSLGASEYAPAVELKKRAGKAVGERYGCALKGDNVILNVRAWALKNMPLLTLATPGPDCTITFLRTAPAEDRSSESVTASVVETRLEEFDPMAAYKRMAAAAAARESEKAFAAGLNASTERMKDTARKMYDYRVRREGDYLVYGQGNFAGQASAGTLSAQAQAQASAQAYARAAQANGMQVREVKEQVDTFYVNVTTFQGIAATIEKKGEPSRKIAPPTESASWSFGPCQRKNHSSLGAHTARGECVTNGQMNGAGAGARLHQRYYNTYVYPFLATFVAESMLPPVLVKVGEAQKSARPGTQLEAKLLAHFANLTPASDAEVSALAEKVTGEKITLREFGDELGLN